MTGSISTDEGVAGDLPAGVDTQSFAGSSSERAQVMHRAVVQECMGGGISAIEGVACDYSARVDPSATLTVPPSVPRSVTVYIGGVAETCEQTRKSAKIAGNRAFTELLGIG